MVKKILSLGHPAFPLGKAQVQRQLLIAKAIMLSGFEVTILCRYGIHQSSDQITEEGFYEGVHYIYCSGTSVRPERFFKRTLLKFKGLYNEFKYVKELSKGKKLGGIIISTNGFHNVLFYFFLGKLFKAIIVIDNVEYWSSVRDYKGLDRVDKYLYDRLYYYFADKIICISDFLISKVNKSSRDKIIKIPVITDYEKFKIKGIKERIIKGRYFVFCGSENYYELIDFVVSAFEEQARRNDAMLVLITKTSNDLSMRLKNSIVKDRISIFSDISYDALINLYCFSIALIIPMRNTDQDKARFPHKIAEYCASGRPIITNCVGEIGNYFDNSNAYICSDYDFREYAEIMSLSINQPLVSDMVGAKSFETGNLYFNYQSYSSKLHKLFSYK